MNTTKLARKIVKSLLKSLQETSGWEDYERTLDMNNERLSAIERGLISQTTELLESELTRQEKG